MDLISKKPSYGGETEIAANSIAQCLTALARASARLDAHVGNFGALDGEGPRDAHERKLSQAVAAAELLDPAGLGVHQGEHLSRPGVPH